MMRLLDSETWGETEFKNIKCGECCTLYIVSTHTDIILLKIEKTRKRINAIELATGKIFYLSPDTLVYPIEVAVAL